MRLFRATAEMTFSQRLTLLHSKRVATFGTALLLKAYAFTLCPSPTLVVDLHRLLINLSSNMLQLPTQSFFKRQTNYKHNYGYGKLISFGLTVQGSLLVVDGCYWLYQCASLPTLALPGANFASLGLFGAAILVEMTSLLHPLDLIYPTQPFSERVKMVTAIITRKLRTHWMLENMTWTTLLNLACCSLPLAIQLLPLLSVNPHISEIIGTASMGLLSM